MQVPCHAGCGTRVRLWNFILGEWRIFQEVKHWKKRGISSNIIRFAS